jgi:hypothetical protein
MREVDSFAASRRRIASLLCAGALLLTSGCATNGPLSANELHALAQPPLDVAATVEKLQPGVARYIREAEQIGLTQGQPLDEGQLQLARTVGVAEPERVRIVVTQRFPVASDADLAAQLSKRFGIGPAANGGLTMGHTIFIGEKYAGKRWLLAHELTHVSQFERFGVERFAHDYLVQMLVVGYARAPLERAAAANEPFGK